ncbi:MarR family winged helix-turn-helix transcriptional regulator [Latilactobacillus graminis]|uniref:MarR family protein n=2 Tax=Latilactobacillus graminis TaxID=60519 RepID=A0AA89KXK8_9LACO|nr:MarR family winged helix-turn-helix transcriptional regulator [Latilactobacillus graminis]KRM23359.1 marR family protein [Latilactobacillus graminis DSM 20719]QFP80288.1 winged helix-turn-helix transcriptional regulator [Latilactobacillus graminis]
MSELSNELFKTFNQVIHRYRHYYGMQFSTDHRSVSQIRILKQLNSENGQIQRVLAERLDIRPSSLSECLHKLAAKHYIERQSDDHDRRITHVFITATGRTILTEALDGHDEFTETLFGSLTHQEQQALNELLNKLETTLSDTQNFDFMSEFNKRRSQTKL